MTKHELKRALSAKLRDPLTDTRSFTRLVSVYGKLNPGWNRKPRRAEKEPDVDTLVLQLERQNRLKRTKTTKV
jgi:hypothetical protein